MNQKQKFIQMVEMLMGLYNEQAGAETPLQVDLNYTEALAYFELFKAEAPAKEKQKFTDNGRLFLTVMRDNIDLKTNLFRASDIAELAFVPSRSVSGAMKKLITDGYVEVVSKNPNIYSVTDLGKTVDMND